MRGSKKGPLRSAVAVVTSSPNGAIACEKGSATGSMLWAASISLPGVKPTSALMVTTYKSTDRVSTGAGGGLVLDVLVARVLGAFELERGVRDGEVVARAFAQLVDDAVARRPVGLVRDGDVRGDGDEV